MKSTEPDSDLALFLWPGNCAEVTAGLLVSNEYR